MNSTGMEVASYLSNKAASVTVVGSSSYPFQNSLGPDIGKMCMQVRNADGCDVNACWATTDFQAECLLSDVEREKREVLHGRWRHGDQRQRWEGGAGLVSWFTLLVLV